MVKHCLIIVCQYLTILHLELKLTSQILVEVFSSIYKATLKIVMRKEVDKIIRMIFQNFID